MDSMYGIFVLFIREVIMAVRLYWIPKLKHNSQNNNHNIEGVPATDITWRFNIVYLTA